MMLRLHLLVSLILISWQFQAQTYHIKRFGEKEGLMERFIYTVDQDSSGYLMIGTGKGVYRYNGKIIEHPGKDDGLQNAFVSASCKLSNGLILYGDYYGNLRIRGQAAVVGQPKGFENERILSIVELPSGIYVLLQSGNIGYLSWTGSVHVYKDLLDGAIPSVMIAEGDSQLLVGSDYGLIQLTVEAKQLSAEWIPDFDGLPVTSVTKSLSGDWFVGTDEMGLFRYSKENGVTEALALGLDLRRFVINHTLETEAGGLWVATNRNGAYRLSDFDGVQYNRFLNPDANEEFDIQSVARLFLDREENIWLATKGGGLILLTPDDFSFYTPGNQFEPERVTAVLNQGENVWVGTENFLFEYTENLSQHTEVYQRENGLPGGPYTSLYVDVDSTLWLGTESFGLFRRALGEVEFTHVPLGEDKLSLRVNKILESERRLYVATDYGIYILERGRLTQHLSMQSGLPHNRVRTLFADSHNRIFIGTQTSSITLINGDDLMSLSMPFGDRLIDLVSFTEDSHGRIWIGTDGAGVVMMDGDRLTALTTIDGLLSDYCYQVEADAYDQIWVGHRGGMTRIDAEDFHVEKLDNPPFNQLGFTHDKSQRTKFGDIYFATDKGLLVYHGNTQLQKHQEPLVNLRYTFVGDSVVDTQSKIEVPFDTYRVEFNFVGITFRDAEEVTYSYILENYDLNWSAATSSPMARYNRLPPGDYIFKVKAYHENGVGGERIASVEVTVNTPFWQKWWFYLIAISFAVLMIYLFIFWRESRLRANQVYLQKELDERTKEVVEQKELLEIKNKDITDSILYAKNIQRAMLPDPQVFDRYFPEAFIYYKPRDIVSGDFYWILKHETKVVVACADCTGHGVPGAFMSMIGTVLLKDVSTSHGLVSPDLALRALNAEIVELLHNKHGNFAVDDGMDISISEYDYATGILRLSSAKRPVVIYKGSERIEIKGDRFSIGGEKNFEGEKTFSLHTVQLSAGDCFYHFTDGIQDQFGGPEGKKLKKSGLVKILDEVHHLDMGKQYQILQKSFNEWKGDLPQIDDILLFGVRV